MLGCFCELMLKERRGGLLDQIRPPSTLSTLLAKVRSVCFQLLSRHCEAPAWLGRAMLGNKAMGSHFFFFLSSFCRHSLLVGESLCADRTKKKNSRGFRCFCDPCGACSSFSTCFRGPSGAHLVWALCSHRCVRRMISTGGQKSLVGLMNEGVLVQGPSGFIPLVPSL
jgi:hypothetical protein